MYSIIYIYIYNLKNKKLKNKYNIYINIIYFNQQHFY